MRTRYNSQSQNILTMKNCLQHDNLNGTPSVDFGFTVKQVHIYEQME